METVSCDTTPAVTIDATGLASLAERLNTEYPAGTPHAPHYATERPAVALPTWESDSYHFRDLSSPEGIEVTAAYVLVLDAINFCFWPAEVAGWEYDTLAGSIKRVAETEGMAGLGGDALAGMEMDTLIEWFGGSPPPRAEQRLRLLRELGNGLNAHFGGSAAALITSAEGSAVELVARIIALFPGFRDETLFRGDQVVFYKRAQIFVGDVWGAFGGSGLGDFHDIAALSMFADYRIPQLLRHLGVLVYAPSLGEDVDGLVQIQAGSEPEIAIRAATVVAVENLRALLHAEWTSVQLDWWLWEEGEANLDSIGPHHRTLTVFY